MSNNARGFREGMDYRAEDECGDGSREICVKHRLERSRLGIFLVFVQGLGLLLDLILFSIKVSLGNRCETRRVESVHAQARINASVIFEMF